MTMSLEQQQVNVQELQRLNEAIVLCIDSMRRVAPQLGQVQAALSGIPGYGTPFWGGQISPFAQGLFGHTPFTQGVYGQTPFTQGVYGQSPFTQGLFTQSPFAQSPFAQSPFTQNPFTHIPFMQMGTMQTPWTGWTNGHFQVPFGQTPYVNLSQRPY
jgi:hypothetical protein